MPAKSTEPFETHWESYLPDAISPQKIAVATEFLKPAIAWINASNGPCRILDAGCGEGIHATVLANNVLRTFQYDGVDISQSAINICRERLANDPRFRFTRLNLETDPLISSFDVIICFGVVAYTNCPQSVIIKLAKQLNPKGLFVNWIYAPSWRERICLRAVRMLAHLGGLRVTSCLASLIVYVMKYLPVSSGVNLSNSSFAQCKESVMVNIAPKILWLPSSNTVKLWHSDANLVNCGNHAYTTVKCAP